MRSTFLEAGQLPNLRGQLEALRHRVLLDAPQGLVQQQRLAGGVQKHVPELAVALDHVMPLGYIRPWASAHANRAKTLQPLRLELKWFLEPHWHEPK